MPTNATLASYTIVITLGYIAWYLAACAMFPFTHCRRCHGTGKIRSPSGKAFRLCRRCKHTGRRLRLGRKIYNHLRAEHRDGTH